MLFVKAKVGEILEKVYECEQLVQLASRRQDHQAWLLLSSVPRHVQIRSYNTRRFIKIIGALETRIAASMNTIIGIPMWTKDHVKFTEETKHPVLHRMTRRALLISTNGWNMNCHCKPIFKRSKFIYSFWPFASQTHTSTLAL